MSNRLQIRFDLPLMLIVIALHPSMAQPRVSPSAYVHALYSRYPLKDDEGGIAFDRDLTKWFTAPLLDALIRDRSIAESTNTIGLDWDPLCDCQDDDGLRLEAVIVGAQTKDTARVTARIWLPGKNVINEGDVVLFLRRVSGEWRIADLASRRTHSLAQFLDSWGGPPVNPTK